MLILLLENEKLQILELIQIQKNSVIYHVSLKIRCSLEVSGNEPFEAQLDVVWSKHDQSSADVWMETLLEALSLKLAKLKWWFRKMQQE